MADASRMALRLHKTILAVCPIDGVSIDTTTQLPAVRIDYKPEATQVQRNAALAAVAAFDWSDAAQQVWEDAQEPEKTTLKQAALDAIAGNNTFLDIPSPTAAQIVTQVRRLTQQCTALIRRLVQL